MTSHARQTSNVRRTLALLAAQPGLLVASIFLSAVVVVSTLLLPVLSGEALDCIVGKGQLDSSRLMQVLTYMGIAIVVTALSQFALNEVSNRLVYGLMRDLRTKAFNKLERLPLAYLDTHPAGDITSRVVTDIEQLSQGLLLGIQQLLVGILTIGITLFFMFQLDPITSLVVVCLTPISAVVTSQLVRKSRLYFTEQNECRAKMTSFVEEMVGGISTLRLFKMLQPASKTFNEIDETLGEAMLRSVFVSSLSNPATRFVNSLVYAGVCVSGAIAVVTRGVTVGGLSAFLSYANQYSKPFNDISSVLSELQNSFACAERVFTLLDEAEIQAELEGYTKLENIKGKVELKDICFSYNPGHEILHELSLSAQPGQTVAIVGPTGCGKTTLINLLMRFYDPDTGSICVDGVDTSRATRASVREHWGMVLQDAWVAAGSIRDNIAMGKPSATDAEIEEAAQRALAHPFIMRLPYGYDTQLSEGGSELSAGQRQLICIARLMLARPPMLILDEATSSIDTRTEQRVQEAMLRLMEGRTSFVVAHRLATIRSADLICVMVEGRIIEQGTHDELLAAQGFYTELYNAQFAHNMDLF